MALLHVASLDEVDTEALVAAGDRIALVEGNPRYPLSITVQSPRPGFTEDYPAYLSSYRMLHDPQMWLDFASRLDADGYLVLVLPSAEPTIRSVQQWSAPVEIAGLRLKPVAGAPPGLLPWQTYGLNRALGLPGEPVKPMFFFNYATGSGKSIVAAAGIQELLVNRRGLPDGIDLAIVLTVRRMKLNLVETILDTTDARAVAIDGTKAKRLERYAAGEYDVLVANYEKARHDREALLEVVRGKRVLFVLDEVQRVVPKGGKPTLAHRGLLALLRACKPIVWAMSASVVNDNPERFFHVFEFGSSRAKRSSWSNPLGTITDFRRKYSTARQMYFGTRVQIERTWKPSLLVEVRHRVTEHTHSVRKSDPAMRPFFRSTRFSPVLLDLSPTDARMYEAIVADLEEKRDIAERTGTEVQQEVRADYFQTLRLLCLLPEAPNLAQSPLAQEIRSVFPRLDSANCAKMEVLLDHLADVQGDGEKALVFSHWNSLGVQLMSRHLSRAGIRHVLHHGAMSERASQEAQQRFKTDPLTTVFLTTDAGAMGLNFPEARTVINYDVPYSYDLLMQRNDRIDRVDSYLDDLRQFVYVTAETVEERIWRVNQQRMQLASVVQGTREDLSRLSDEDVVPASGEMLELMLGGR